eukprot:9704867-Alexandrium_andersonii.AAC.1
MAPPDAPPAARPVGNAPAPLSTRPEPSRRDTYPDARMARGWATRGERASRSRGLAPSAWPCQTQDRLQAGEAAWKNRFAHGRAGWGKRLAGRRRLATGGPAAPPWNSLTLARPTQTDAS